MEAKRREINTAGMHLFNEHKHSKSFTEFQEKAEEMAKGYFK